MPVGTFPNLRNDRLLVSCRLSYVPCPAINNVIEIKNLKTLAKNKTTPRTSLGDRFPLG